jgi:hypothetical protein
VNESESLALLMTDKVEGLSKSFEKQTEAIYQLVSSHNSHNNKKGQNNKKRQMIFRKIISKTF